VNCLVFNKHCIFQIFHKQLDLLEGDQRLHSVIYAHISLSSFAISLLQNTSFTTGFSTSTSEKTRTLLTWKTTSRFRQAVKCGHSHVGQDVPNGHVPNGSEV
jgi:hypothetical protein